MADWAALRNTEESEQTVDQEQVQTGGTNWAAIKYQQPEALHGEPDDQEDLPMRQLISNIPGSAKQYFSDMLTFIKHPKATAETMGQLIAGFTQKLVPGEQPDEWKADAMVDFFKERYGSLENAKRTLINDPVGVMADLSSVVTPIGGLLQKAGLAGKMSRVSTVGGVVKKAGALMDPVTGPATLTGRGLAAVIPSKMSQEWYKSASKFSTTLSHQERTKLTETALKYEIMPTIEGLNKIEDMIGDIDSQITRLIDEATMSGKKIPLRALFTHLGEMRKTAMRKEVNGISAANEVSKIYRDMYKANKKIGRKSLTPKEAQDIKKTIYRRLQTAYEKTAKAPIATETKQAIANSTKEAIENIFPEIKSLNRRDGDLIELHKALQRSSSRIANRDLMGIGLALKSSMGAALGGVGAAAVGAAPEVGATIGGVAGVVLGIIDSPKVKAKIAILANKLKKRGVNINAKHAIYRLGLVQLGRQVGEKEWKHTQESVDYITD